MFWKEHGSLQQFFGHWLRCQIPCEETRSEIESWQRTCRRKTRNEIRENTTFVLHGNSRKRKIRLLNVSGAAMSSSKPQLLLNVPFVNAHVGNRESLHAWEIDAALDLPFRSTRHHLDAVSLNMREKLLFTQLGLALQRLNRCGKFYYP